MNETAMVIMVMNEARPLEVASIVQEWFLLTQDCFQDKIKILNNNGRW